MKSNLTESANVDNKDKECRSENSCKSFEEPTSSEHLSDKYRQMDSHDHKKHVRKFYERSNLTDIKMFS